MAKIQFDCPEDINIELGVYALRHKIKDKRDAIIKILRASLIKIKKVE
jgi:hypothetical protein